MKDRSYEIAWSPDSTHIASASEDNTVQIWNARNGINVYTYKGHSDGVHTVVWLNDGKRIVSASRDKIVQIWDTVTGDQILSTRIHFPLLLLQSAVDSMELSSDGTYLARGNHYHEVTVFHTVTGTHISSYSTFYAEDHTSTVRSRYIHDKKLPGRPCEAHFIMELFRPACTRDPIWAIAWSPDGTHISSASTDMTVQVWKAKTGSNVLTYQGHTNVVYAIAWSPDGSSIASGDYDGIVKVWQVV